jgi:Na+/citrate or Na+/malate symporter
MPVFMATLGIILPQKGKRTEIIEQVIDGPSIWIVVKGTIEIEVVIIEKGKQMEKLRLDKLCLSNLEQS